jgi:hypothetical protein
MWASGVSNSSMAADLDENGEPGFRSHLRGGGNLGPVTLDTMGDLTVWDGVSFCDFDPASGAPIAVEIYYIGFSTVIRTIGGDQIYIESNGSAPGTFCFNFVDNTSTYEVLGDIVGGTGRYAGASGWINISGSGTALANLDPFDANIRGEIHLQSKK